MTETEEVTVDKKDITYDILIDDTEERPDRGASGASSGPAEEKGDHPAIAILDMAIKQSAVFLKEQGLPPANNAVYESFSKPFLNEALWHYLPEGTLPDDPRFALVMGVAGLGLAFSPTLIALYHKREEEKKREEQEKKRKKERRSEENDEREEEEKEEKRIVMKNPVTGKEYPVKRRSEVGTPEVVPSPDWMTRLEGGALRGM